MRLANPFSGLALRELLGTLLPDFVLAFAFFTALAYAVLGKRFDHQLPVLPTRDPGQPTGLRWHPHFRPLLANRRPDDASRPNPNPRRHGFV